MGLNRTALRLVLTLLAASAPAVSALAQNVRQHEFNANDQADDFRLVQVFNDEARRSETLDPLDAIYRGEEISPSALAQTFSDELDRKRLASARQAMRALEKVDRNRLNPEFQISHDVFAYDQRETIAWLQPDIRGLMAVRPFNHFGGMHVEFPSAMTTDGAFPYQREADYRAALSLHAAFPQALDNSAQRMREGIRSGITDPSLTIINMIAQIDALLAQPVEQSPFYAPVLAFPAEVPPASRPALKASFAASVRDTLYPAYRRFRTFLAEEYLPSARTSIGLSQMKGGAALYRRLIERETTLRLDPETVHQLGLSEVARIHQDMEKVKLQLGDTGPLRQFFDTMRTNPRFHPSSRAQLADGFVAYGRAVEAQIPKFFNRVPRTNLVIQPYPVYREKFEAGGSYSEGSPDGSRPGVFFFNTYDLPSRFLTGMATLYLHEGIPGHHFQISLALENRNLPPFQRINGNTAFVEGWALYAETLGYDMGLFDDPMQHWGTLDDEMLRAMRLVVDTGIHAKGWSREQAIDYMLANSGMGRSDAVAEVERYVAIPAQALAYKIGALTIQRLRRKAQTALGPRFDIRAFHDQVLGSGALPLPILEAKIDRWIARQAPARN